MRWQNYWLLFDKTIVKGSTKLSDLEKLGKSKDLKMLIINHKFRERGIDGPVNPLIFASYFLTCA